MMSKTHGYPSTIGKPKGMKQYNRTVIDDCLEMAEAIQTMTSGLGSSCPVCRQYPHHDPMCPVFRWRKINNLPCPHGCEYVQPYGFVVAEGCPIHDKE